MMNLQINPISQFLRDELHISDDAIPHLLQECTHPNRLAVALWQQKLVTVTQLDDLFRCLEPFVDRRLESSHN